MTGAHIIWGILQALQQTTAAIRLPLLQCTNEINYRLELNNEGFTRVLFSIIDEAFNRLRIIMVRRRQSYPYRAQRSCHILSCELKVENAYVFLHPILVYRFEDDGDASLDQESQSHLSNRFTMLLPDLIQGSIDEKVVPAFGKGPQDSICVL